MDKRLSEIKYRLQMAKELFPELEDLKPEILIKLYESGHLDWLVEQAEKLEKAETLIKKIYRIAGASAEVDVKLWKEAEEYLGGREKARAALEELK